MTVNGLLSPPHMGTNGLFGGKDALVLVCAQVQRNWPLLAPACFLAAAGLSLQMVIHCLHESCELTYYHDDTFAALLPQNSAVVHLPFRRLQFGSKVTMETENFEATPGWWNKKAIINLLFLCWWRSNLWICPAWNMLRFSGMVFLTFKHFNSTASFSSTYRTNLKVWRLLLVLLVVSKHHSFTSF